MTVKEIVSLMIDGQIFKVEDEHGKILYNGIKEYGRETSINGLRNKEVWNICSSSYLDFCNFDFDDPYQLDDTASIDEICIIVWHNRFDVVVFCKGLISFHQLYRFAPRPAKAGFLLQKVVFSDIMNKVKVQQNILQR